MLSTVAEDTEGETKVKRKNRCFMCNKKVGLTGWWVWIVVTVIMILLYSYVVFFGGWWLCWLMMRVVVFMMVMVFFCEYLYSGVVFVIAGCGVSGVYMEVLRVEFD